MGRTVAGMHPFRAAIEARDVDAAVALFADDVVFRSPVAFKAYHGRATVAQILHTVIEVFEDFRYVREIGAHDADDHVLVFQARSVDRRRVRNRIGVAEPEALARIFAELDRLTGRAAGP